MNLYSGSEKRPSRYLVYDKNQYCRNFDSENKVDSVKFVTIMCHSLLPGDFVNFCSQRTSNLEFLGITKKHRRQIDTSRHFLIIYLFGLF